MKKYDVKDIIDCIKDDYNLIGDTEGKYFTNVKPVNEADEDSLVWIKGAKDNKRELLQQTKSKIIICDETLTIEEEFLMEKCFIVVNNPKLVFIRVVENLFVREKQCGIHPTAVVDPEAEIHPSAYIGAFTFVGKSKIGENTYIYGHCFIYDGVAIGKNVTIHAGTVIGSDGFGYSRNEKYEFEKFPHVGGIIIEDNVEIGSNTSIDRGALGNTLIKEGTKIDNLVHIGHNCIIGRHCAIIANTMLGGSVEIKDYSWVAPSASILNQLKIGEKVTVGMGAVVTKSVPDGETWTGVPAKHLKEFADIQKAIKKLIK